MKSWLKIIPAFLLLLFFSCHHKTYNELLLDNLELSADTCSDEIPLNLNDPLRKMDLDRVVYKISTLQSISCGIAGYSGERFAVVDYAMLLRMNSSTEELVALTNHDNPYVRHFAFEALARQKYMNLKPIYLQHLKDTEFYIYQCGCEGNYIPIKEDFFNMMNGQFNYVA